MKDFLLQNEIVKNKVQKYVQKRIRTATNCVTERFHGDEPPERNIQPFDEIYNISFDASEMIHFIKFKVQK